MVLYNGNAEVIGNFRALNFYKASDINIKEDIRLLSDGMNTCLSDAMLLMLYYLDHDCRDTLMRINGVNYKFKPGVHPNVNKRFVGYIAQQVESVVPSAVQLIDGILHVDYESLIPYLSESIRQNFNDIKNIKADNEKLQQALDSIYDAFIDKKSRDSSATITPFAESKQSRSKAIPLAWRIMIILIAVSTMAVAVSAVIFFALRDPTPNAPIKSDEQKVLESLYHATNGIHWTNSKNWLTDQPVCEWYGITCQDGSVYSIALPENNMTGSFPPNINLLANLRHLDLQSNRISGTIPDSITMMTKLEYIALSGNYLLAGTIPQDIGFLRELVFFGVAGNILSGSVPKSMSALQNLRQLILEDNDFDGPILETLVGLKNLALIALRHNRFTGTIPESIGNLSKLQELDLSFNLFDGTIPKSIGSLTAMKAFNCHSNLFNGEIPENIFRLPELKDLDLSLNAFKSTIPKSIGEAKLLELLDLSENNLHGTLPEVICNSQLSRLILNSNALTGTIPDTFTKCINLAQIDLAVNQLNGTIPDSLFANKPLLGSLSLGHNNLTGTIPSQITSIHLNEVYLNNNQLHGTIPEFKSGLSQLDLSYNALEGILPRLPASLIALLLNNNNVTGTLDSLVTMEGSQPSLELVDLSCNNFTGDLPDVLLFTSLRVFNVSHNMFTNINKVPTILQCDASFNSFKCPLPSGADRCKATCM